MRKGDTGHSIEEYWQEMIGDGTQVGAGDLITITKTHPWSIKGNADLKLDKPGFRGTKRTKK